MTYSVEGAIEYIQALWLAIPGVEAAPDNPVEASAAMPFAITYEQDGEFVEQSHGFAYDLATLVSEVHVARQLLPLSIATAYSLRTPFLQALMDDPTLGGTVETTRGIRRRFGGMTYGDDDNQTIGYRFEIEIKLIME